MKHHGFKARARSGGPEAVRRLVGSVLMSCLPLAGISAQDIAIRDCAAPCPLSLELVGTFGDDEGPGMIATAWGVPDNDGRWYLVDGPSAEIKVYDSAGRFLHRFGRRGQGPGEFDRIRHVFPMGDSVIGVLDDPSGLKFFDPAGRLLRETRLPFVTRGAVYADGLGLVVAAHVPTPERAGLPLHLIDLEVGSVALSFGSTTEEYRLSEADGGSRVLAEGPVGSVWAARETEYRIELWTKDGLQRTLVRDVPWFPRVTRRDEAHGWYERPNTQLVGLAATDSQLWVKIAVADENWHEGSDSRDIDLVFDNIIEVIDLRALRVVGRVRLDEAASKFGGPGVIGTTVVTPEGSVRYQVFRILAEPSSDNRGVGSESGLPATLLDNNR